MDKSWHAPDFESKNALSKISQLNGVTFEWKDKEEHPEKYHNIREAGIIAQDVVKVLPEAVKTREHNGYMAVKYEQLIQLLIEGIKEQQTILLWLLFITASVGFMF